MRRAILLLVFPVLLSGSALAAGHDISTVRYVPSGNPGNVTMLYDGASFVTVAGVYSVRTDPATGVTTPAAPLPPQPAAVPNASRSKTAFNNGLVLVSSRTTSYGRDVIRAATFGRDGSPVASVLLPAPGVDSFDVAPSGEGFAVVTAGRSGVRLFRLDASGAIALDHTIVLGDFIVGFPLTVSVAPGAGRTVVAWTVGNTPQGYVASVTADGVGSVELLPSVSASVSRLGAVQALATRTGYAVVWGSSLSSGSQLTAAVRLDAAGHVVDAKPTTIAERPFVAAAASPDVIAVATATPQQADMAITTAVPREGGFDVRPPAAVLVPATQWNVKLASDGVDYVGVWQERESSSAVLMVGRVSRSGDPVDGPSVKLTLSSSLDISIARGAGGDALIVAAGSMGVYAFRWSRSAGVLDAAPIVLADSPADGAAVAWNGTRYLVVWSANDVVAGSRSRELLGRFVGSDGSRSSRIVVPAFHFAGAPDKYSQNPAVAWDGRQFLVAAPMFPREPCLFECPFPPADEVRLARLSAEGVPLDDRGVAIPGVHLGVRVASSGREFLVAFDDGTFVIVKSGANGIDAGTIRRFVTPVDGASIGADVVWDGAAYVMTWLYRMRSGSVSWLESIRSDRSGELSGWSYARTIAPSDFRPSVAANDLGESAVGLDEVTPQTKTSRARLYLTSEMRLTPPAPAPPRSVVSHLAGTSALLTWESDGADAFIIERASRGAWYFVAMVGGTERQAVVSAQAGDLFRVRSFGPGGASDGPVTTIQSEPRVRSAGR